MINYSVKLVIEEVSGNHFLGAKICTKLIKKFASDFKLNKTSHIVIEIQCYLFYKFFHLFILTIRLST